MIIRKAVVVWLIFWISVGLVGVVRPAPLVDENQENDVGHGNIRLTAKPTIAPQTPKVTAQIPLPETATTEEWTSVPVRTRAKTVDYVQEIELTNTEDEKVTVKTTSATRPTVVEKRAINTTPAREEDEGEEVTTGPFTTEALPEEEEPTTKQKPASKSQKADSINAIDKERAKKWTPVSVTKEAHVEKEEHGEATKATQEVLVNTVAQKQRSITTVPALEAEDEDTTTQGRPQPTKAPSDARKEGAKTTARETTAPMKSSTPKTASTTETPEEEEKVATRAATTAATKKRIVASTETPVEEGTTAEQRPAPTKSQTGSTDTETNKGTEKVEPVGTIKAPAVEQESITTASEVAQRKSTVKNVQFKSETESTKVIRTSQVTPAAPIRTAVYIVQGHAYDLQKIIGLLNQFFPMANAKAVASAGSCAYTELNFDEHADLFRIAALKAGLAGVWAIPDPHGNWVLAPSIPTANATVTLAPILPVGPEQVTPRATVHDTTKPPLIIPGEPFTMDDTASIGTFAPAGSQIRVQQTALMSAPQFATATPAIANTTVTPVVTPAAPTRTAPVTPAAVLPMGAEEVTIGETVHITTQSPLIVPAAPFTISDVILLLATTKRQRTHVMEEQLKPHWRTVLGSHVTQVGLLVTKDIPYPAVTVTENGEGIRQISYQVNGLTAIPLDTTAALGRFRNLIRTAKPTGVYAAQDQ